MVKNNISENSLYFLLLALGAQTMVVELTIPRLIAPVFGNTMFSWTAIIAIVMTALSIGYSIGGKLSSKRNSDSLIYIFAIASSIWISLLAISGDWFVAQLQWSGILFGPLLASAILAAVPAFLGAAIVPLTVELVDSSAGNSSGACFAWSTIGSILGVLLTGYILLPNLGITGTLFTGPVLVITAIFYNRKHILGAFGSLIIVCLFFLSSNDGEYLLDKSNGYHRILVTENENSGIRYLKLDSTIEGAILKGSDIPVLNYQKSILPVAQSITNLQDVIFLGGGSFSMPRYIKSLYPDSDITTIEIDKDVIDVANKYLELSTDINVENGDARHVLSNNSKKYDLIVNDAFHGVRNIPFHLVTREFNEMLKTRLSEHGVYAINTIGHPKKSRLIKSITNTLKKAFPYVSLYVNNSRQVSNVWILSSSIPLNIGKKFVSEIEQEYILTDNNAPVEYLIASEIFRH